LDLTNVASSVDFRFLLISSSRFSGELFGSRFSPGYSEVPYPGGIAGRGLLRSLVFFLLAVYKGTSPCRPGYSAPSVVYVGLLPGKG